MPHLLPRSLSRFASAALFLLALLHAGPVAAAAAPQIKTFPLPAEVRSTHYTVRINGRRADVMHAASSYYLLNFDTDGPVTVSVTAEDAHFWDRGVEIQPMRLGIRPVRKGATITFPMAGPGQLTVSRPGDHFADADMLFVFANPRETPPDPHQIRYFGPGIHHENIDAHTGDRIYLDGGAVVFGAANLWQVKDVRIFGRGTIIYDGPQDPHSDEGWMHKPNWHCMVMDAAENIEVDGITCITRSRTWQIQMKDSHHIGFYNVKVVGGNPNDANQDGLDWLGGGDTTVKNSFFRASDDVFALQGNWEGYDIELLKRPGHDVTNITIEGTVASTSVSNTIRVGWPQKTFNSAHFHMSDMDVIHTGFGGCKVPFAFFELWADPDGHGRHEDYSFRNIRLEDWYSLYQMRQPAPEIRDVAFADVWAMDGAAMVPPVMKGDVSGVLLSGASVQGFKQAAVEVQPGARAPHIEPAPTDDAFTYTPGRLQILRPIQFIATAADEKETSFEWLFGDGTRSQGRTVEHRFADAQGTLLDGTGRYRVLLHVKRKDGREAWGSQAVVLERKAHAGAESMQGSTRIAPKLEQQAESRAEDLRFEVPADGGYSFTLLTSTRASFAIDDLPAVASPKPRPQVCGAPGNAVQPMRQSAVLVKGTHHLHIVRDGSLENTDVPLGAPKGSPLILWEGPGISRQLLPAKEVSAVEMP